MRPYMKSRVITVLLLLGLIAGVGDYRGWFIVNKIGRAHV